MARRTCVSILLAAEGVTRDSNNSLTILRSSVDLPNLPTSKAERRERGLDAMSQAVERAASLTDQLLAFSRRALTPDIVDVTGWLRGARDMLYSVAGSRVRAVVEAPEGCCFMRADVLAGILPRILLQPTRARLPESAL